jgi:hypothetical protein
MLTFPRKMTLGLMLGEPPNTLLVSSTNFVLGTLCPMSLSLGFGNADAYLR